MGSICTRNPIEINRVPSQVTAFSRNYDIRKKYKFISILGSGSFGKVRLCCDINCNQMKYAIKTLVKEGISKKIFDYLISEVNILRSLDHPNIVKYYEAVEHDYYLPQYQRLLNQTALMQYQPDLPYQQRLLLQFSYN